MHSPSTAAVDDALFVDLEPVGLLFRGLDVSWRDATRRDPRCVRVVDQLFQGRVQPQGKSSPE